MLETDSALSADLIDQRWSMDDLVAMTSEWDWALTRVSSRSGSRKRDRGSIDMGCIGSMVMGLGAIVWGASSLVLDPGVDAHPTSRGWGQPPVWIGPNPYLRLFGGFLVL